MRHHFSTVLHRSTSLLMLLLIGSAAFAQYTVQNKQWIFNDIFLEVDGNQTQNALPQPGMYNFIDLEYVGQTAQYCQNMLQDRNGDPLLFVVDHRVYDQNGFLVDLFPVNGSYISQEALIFPNPNTCDEYFVVISTQGRNTPELHWMNISTSSGTPVATQSGSHRLRTYYRFSSRTARLAVTEAVDDNYTGSGKTRFIYASAGYHLIQYKVDGSAIDHVEDYGLNDQASFGGGYYDDDYRTEMEIISVDNGSTKFMLAVPYWSFRSGVSNQPAIAFVELNADGFPVNGTYNGLWNTNAQEVLMSNATDWPKGLEFAPGAGHLVFTATQAPHLRYIDVQNASSGWTDLNSLPNVNIANPAQYRYGMIEYGRGGFLWIASANNQLTPFRALPQYWSNLNAWYHTPSQIISGLSLNVTDGNLGVNDRSNLILMQDQIDLEDYENKDPWGIIGSISGPSSIYGGLCGNPQNYTASVNLAGGNPNWLNPVVPNGNGYSGTYTAPMSSLGANLVFEYDYNGCTYSKTKYVNVQCDDGEVDHDFGFGKQQEPALSEFEVYPNPSHSIIHLRGLDKGQLSIVDVLGREVFKGQFSDGQEVDLAHLERGVYTLRAIEVNGDIHTRKLILQ